MIYKFYSPLKVELEDADFGELMELDNNSIIECYDTISTKIKDYNNKTLNNNGLMEYFDEDKTLEEVVETAIPMIGVLGGKPYGIMLVKTKDDVLLNALQFRKLKEFFSGQYSDGWGEGFEQREIETHLGTIYVHFWQYEGFYIKEESEMNKGYYNEERLRKLRELYPKGTIVELKEGMEGEQNKEGKSTMPAGLRGKVTFVDDIGDIHVNWENGSTLAIVPTLDVFEIVEDNEEKMNLEL